jgi:predicted nucleotidyltransferase
MCDKNTLNLITQKICAAAKEVLGDKLEKVILFGSYARGDYDEESDIDIMVIADIAPEDADDARNRINRLAGDLDLEYNVVIYLSIECGSKFHKYVSFVPFYMNAQKDGVELHA